MNPEEAVVKEAVEYALSKAERLGLHSTHVLLWTVVDAYRASQARLAEALARVKDGEAKP